MKAIIIQMKVSKIVGLPAIHAALMRLLPGKTVFFTKMGKNKMAVYMDDKYIGRISEGREYYYVDVAVTGVEY